MVGDHVVPKESELFADMIADQRSKSGDQPIQLDQRKFPTVIVKVTTAHLDRVIGSDSL